MTRELRQQTGQSECLARDTRQRNDATAITSRESSHLEIAAFGSLLSTARLLCHSSQRESLLSLSLSLSRDTANDGYRSTQSVKAFSSPFGIDLARLLD
jgi:hypothetical protein